MALKETKITEFSAQEKLFKERTETFPTNVCINHRRIRRKTKSRPIR